MAFSSKFQSLHVGEESIRVQSVAEIEKSSDMLLHVATAEAALDIIDHFALRYATDVQDELVVQLLGIRLFNAGGLGMSALLSGYYQNAAMQMRDILETWFLIDYFSIRRENITRWRTVDARTREREFAPVEIRKALDIRDGFEGKKRAEHYKLLSAFGAHPTPESFRLYRHEPNGLSTIGPFFSSASLAALLNELAKLMIASAGTFGHMFEIRRRSDQLAQIDLLDAQGKWTSRFSGGKYEPEVIAEFRAKVLKWPEVLPRRPSPSPP